MSDTQSTDYPDRAAVAEARERLRVFEEDVEHESWKHAHARAMQCFDFEETLNTGIRLFDVFLRLDEMMREWAFKQPADSAEPAKVLSIMRESMVWWLRPCARVERELAAFEQEGFHVALAAEFRKRHAEAVWMLADAAEAFDSDKMAQARDAAIDECAGG